MRLEILILSICFVIWIIYGLIILNSRSYIFYFVLSLKRVKNFVVFKQQRKESRGEDLYQYNALHPPPHTHTPVAYAAAQSNAVVLELLIFVVYCCSHELYDSVFGPCFCYLVLCVLLGLQSS